MLCAMIAKSRFTMPVSSSAWYYELLACPDCTQDVSDGSLRCLSCSYSAPLGDLRSHDPRPFVTTMRRDLRFDPIKTLAALETTAPASTYQGPRAIRDSTSLMSGIMQWFDGPCRVLDLGCGPKDQKLPVEFLGHSYVGVDYDSTKADMLADGHALPFQLESMDCVLSYAVLEHLHNPYIAISEIERVLRPGGLYVGTVSQGEPFHHSYFHHTAWALLSLFASRPSLRPVRMWPSGDTLGSLACMGSYSKPVRKSLALLDAFNTATPWLTPRKARLPARDRQIDAIHRAGSIAFLVEKVAAGA
jgi:SAM-dependent methyltransferase